MPRIIVHGDLTNLSGKPFVYAKGKSDFYKTKNLTLVLEF
mgnify:CR=1 FL=1